MKGQIGFIMGNTFSGPVKSSNSHQQQQVVPTNRAPELPPINIERFLSPNRMLNFKPLDWVATKLNITIPPDIWRKIAEYLDLRGLLSLRATCKALVGLRTDPSVQLKKAAFGKHDWETIFEDVGEEPPFSTELLQALEEPCPFSSDPRIKVKDTHLVVWIPPLVREQLQGSNPIFESNLKGEWILLTKVEKVGFLEKNYQERKEIIDLLTNYNISAPIETTTYHFASRIKNNTLYLNQKKLISESQGRDISIKLAWMAECFTATGLKATANIYKGDPSKDVVGVRKFNAKTLENTVSNDHKN